MKMVKATEKYEAWLAGHLTIIQSDLELKHQYMAGDVFTFMRATFYRWMQIWFEEKDFKKLSEAPAVAIFIPTTLVPGVMSRQG